MRAIRRTAAALVALLAALGGAAVIVQTPAAAHENGDYTCPSGAVCMWYHHHYSGGRYDFYGTNATIHEWDIADNDSSWRNNGESGLKARIWHDASYGGDLNLCLSVGTRYAHDPGSYKDTTNPVNDEASSNDWRATC